MLHPVQELGLFFLFLRFSPSLSDPIYMAIDGDAVLKPPPMDSPIKNIEWKHNEDIAADWHGNDFECFGQFKGRCEVNNNTGVLTIKGLKLTDSGNYTPEINGRVLIKIDLSAISHIAKPSVKTSCNTEMTNCQLTCEGNNTNAKPVVYKWFVDGRDGPSHDNLIITKVTKENSFRCLVMNPVSNETSESVTNPFIKQIYGAKGEDVILRPPPMNDTIQRIEWKHNENIAAGWYGDEFECLGQFEGCCEVDTDSGELTIKKLNLNDSGIYTPEINGRDSSKTHLSVISRVAKPSVETSCDTEMTSCLLTCEGNTAEAEPITYMWFKDDKDGPSDKVLIITKDKKENSFRCLMMNPVSNETSESITNPFLKQKQDWLASILVPVLVVVIGVAAYFIYRCIRRGDVEREEGTEEEMRRLKTSPDAEVVSGQPKDNQHLSNGAVASATQGTSHPVIQNAHGRAQTESETPETSNQSPEEAAVSDTDQESELTSVEVHNPPASGCLHTNKDSEKSALSDKLETNCEPSADEQRADDGGDVD